MHSRIRVNSPHVISEHIDGETVMINLQSGTYYSLNASGARVWALLPHDGGVTSDEVAHTLAAQHLEPSDLQDDVATFFGELLGEELVVPVGNDSTPPGSAPNGDGTAQALASQPWEAPSLTRFDDMQDLLLLDPVHEVDERGWPHVPSDND